jgi:UDP-glucose 4-epimerase|tara:strand:- start:894 stop:1820 length:927 start_codon:yes stop_codon:yes gene_type:complete
MKEVLVTGGGGFIGKKVAQELLNRGIQVRLFDLVKSNIKGVNCDYVGSILDPYKLSHVMKGCSHVIHLAAALGVNRTETNRLECLLINIQGTINVLETCVKERVEKIIFASSSEVYGEQPVQPIIEEALLNPKSNYAASKIVGEEFMKAYLETYKMKYNIVRFFNVYGEDQRDEFVVPRFVKNIVNDKHPDIYGEGDQIRGFCYVEDAARGIVDVLSSPVESEIFNIGNDSEPISMKDLASKIIKISNKNLKPQFVSYNDSDRGSHRDIMQRIPSIEKAKKELGYRPKVSLEEGIKKMIGFYEAKNNC